MKKTLTVNLNNVVFHIDDDAYELLQNYLSAVEKQLSEDERKEVMSDIEARVAELFTERLQRNKCGEQGRCRANYRSVGQTKSVWWRRVGN